MAWEQRGLLVPRTAASNARRVTLGLLSTTPEPSVLVRACVFITFDVHATNPFTLALCNVCVAITL